MPPTLVHGDVMPHSMKRNLSIRRGLAGAIAAAALGIGGCQHATVGNYDTSLTNQQNQERANNQREIYNSRSKVYLNEPSPGIEYRPAK
jgi:hypothetical protein